MQAAAVRLYIRIRRPDGTRGFFCSAAQVQIGVGFQQSLGAGIFGVDGFLFQKLSGQGVAWLELSGELILKDRVPAKPYESVPATWAFLSHQGLSRSLASPASAT